MIDRFHHITQHVEGCTHAQLAEDACKGGARWIQLRVKNTLFAEWKKVAEQTQDVCLRYGAKLIINDNVQLAKEIGADGVHLGKEDMAIDEAREILGSHVIIGATANTFEDVEHHSKAGADYIGLGPFRFTTTKENLSPVLGLQGYRSIVNKMKDCGINIPLVAIGGIRREDVSALFTAGVYGIAVSSAINLEKSRSEAAGKFLEELQQLQRSF